MLTAIKFALCAAIFLSTAATASAATKRQKTTAHRGGVRVQTSVPRPAPPVNPFSPAATGGGTPATIKCSNAIDEKGGSQKDFADVPNAARVANGTSMPVLKGTSLMFPMRRCKQFERVSGTRIGKARCHARGRRSARPMVCVARSTGMAPASTQIHPNRLRFTLGGDAMARNTMDFARQNTEQATDWVRAIAEQNLNQSKAAFEGLLGVARNAVRDVDQQAAVICEHSMSFAEETLSNAFNFAHKLLRMREPQEFAQIQGEFVSRQAQLLGDQTKELGQKIMQGAQDAAKSVREASAESSRRRSEAA